MEITVGKETRFDPSLTKLLQTLSIDELVSQIVRDYRIWKIEDANERPGDDLELNELCLARRYVKQDAKEKLKDLLSRSLLFHFDCLTYAILVAVLVNSEGYPVQVARPNQLRRHFHALVLRSNGEIFKVAGRSSGYKVKVLDEKQIMRQLYLTRIPNRMFKDVTGSLTARITKLLDY